MKVSINTNSINQVINADVVNIDQIKMLSKENQTQVINELIKNINEQLNNLIKNPIEISTNKILETSEAIKNSIDEISASKKAEDKKSKVGGILKTIKENLGSTSDIILNVVKLATIFGI